MSFLRDEEVIVAQGTPQGAGAIAMIRLSGIGAIKLVDSASKIPGGQQLSNQNSHTIHYGWVTDQDGKHIDQVLFLLMKAPRTFTGQDTVEITCHNNQFLVEKIIDRLIQVGARIAQPGEFTKRAMIEGKIDALQAEAINDLIHAQTDVAIKKSLSQLEGSFSSWIMQFEKRLLQLVGLCEASFEFLDEEMSFDDQIREHLDELQKDIDTILATFDKQQYVKEGVRIAFVGSANAGKSSLFNALLNKERAIVTNIAGTTRDSIEAGIAMQGTQTTLVDTAGLRETQDIVEKKGIDRSFQEAVQADIILLIFDGSTKYSEQEINEYHAIIKEHAHKTICVQNKVDLGSEQVLKFDEVDIVPLSVVSNKNIDVLRKKIQTKISDLMQIGQTPCLLNKRQYGLLKQLAEKLQSISSRIKKSVEHEIVAMQLRELIEILSELTGKTVSEKALDAIFKDFCVGK